jgi:hypothetical protein
MELQEIADRIELDQLIVRYAECIDAKDWDGLDSVFTADAHLDYTSSGGPAASGDLPTMKAWLRQMLGTGMFPTTQHLVGKSLVTYEGDRAHCRTMFHNPMGVAVDDEGYYCPGGPKLHVFVVGGWYEDTCVRTPDGWRIAAKIEQQAFTSGGFPPLRPSAS